MKSKCIVCLLLAGCLLLGTSSCSLLPAEEELPTAPVYNINNVTYTQTAVARGDIIQNVTVNCKYNAAVEEKLSFGADGISIAHVYVQKGDSVTAGQLLAELDITDVQEKIDAQKQVISDLQTTYAFLKESRTIAQQKENVELDEIQYKISIGSATQAQYDAKASAVRSAQTAYENNCSYYESLLSIEQTRMKEIEQELQARRIYSGINGVVRFVRASDEKTLSNSSITFFVISDVSTAFFSTNVNDETYFAVGDKVQIVSGDYTYDAEVTGVTDTSVSSKSKKYDVAFQLDVPAPNLQTGDSGKITLTLNERRGVLYLPSDLVYGGTNANMVYYLDENGLLSSKVVQTGLTANDMTEIVSGLEEGDLVVEKS